jgi:ATP-dependent Clp protease ATP-binding subunit ClpA
MFERFNAAAVKAIMEAQQEARRLNSNQVGSEQLFLGVIAAHDGPSDRALKKCDVTLYKARTAVEQICGRGSNPSPDEIPFTEGAKRSLEASWEASRSWHQKFIGAEHLLVGILQQADPAVNETLKRLGVNPVVLEQETLGEMTSPSVAPSEAESLQPDGAFLARATEAALYAVEDAQIEAQRSALDVVDSGQLLLGLLAQSKGIAANVFWKNGIKLNDARRELDAIVGKRPDEPADRNTGRVMVPFTPRAKRILDLAWEEASERRLNYIGTEHLLLALLSDREGVAALVLDRLGVDLDALRQSVFDALDKLNEKD